MLKVMLVGSTDWFYLEYKREVNGKLKKLGPAARRVEVPLVKRRIL